MHDENSQCSSTKTARRQLGVRGQRRQWGLDARTATSRRLRSIMEDLAHQYGVPFDISDAFLRRCSELVLTTEQTRLALIRHESGINIDHLLRLEGLTIRACRDLSARARVKPNDVPDLQTYLRQLAERDGAVAEHQQPVAGDRESDAGASGDAPITPDHIDDEKRTGDVLTPRGEAA